jgi:uncharacterized protein
MLDVIKKLIVLQDRDQKIFRTKTELKSIEPQRVAMRDKMSKCEAILENAKTQSNHVESARKDLENEVSAKKDQINKYSQQQLDTKKNEEYKALNNQIDTCKKAIVELEDKQLDLMEEAENVAVVVANAKKEAAEIQDNIDAQIGKMDDREKELKSELDELKSDRGDLAEAVDRPALRLYERLLKVKPDPVVGVTTENICGGCHMLMPVQVVVSTRQDQDLINCPNCGRILFFTEEADYVETA